MTRGSPTGPSWAERQATGLSPTDLVPEFNLLTFRVRCLLASECINSCRGLRLRRARRERPPFAAQHVCGLEQARAEARRQAPSRLFGANGCGLYERRVVAVVVEVQSAGRRQAEMSSVWAPHPAAAFRSSGLSVVWHDGRGGA